MAKTITIPETYPKAEGYTAEMVEAERQQWLQNTHVVNCLKTEDEENFYLVVVMRVAEAGDDAGNGAPGGSGGASGQAASGGD